MASLTELEQWEEQIYQLETTDPVKGGDDGISNRQAKQLGNRTKYLKKLILDAIGSDTNFAATVTNLLSQKVSIQDLQKGKYIFATDTGVANAYVCNLTPAITERDEGQVIRFKVANANSGTSTINDGLGVVPLVGGAHAALQGGELVAGGDAWIQWHPYVGAGSYVLLFCTGAAVQVAKAKKSNQVVNLGQSSGMTFRGQYHKLTATAGGSGYTASATAETLVVADSDYNCIGLRNVSVSVNGANSGANGLDTGTIAAGNWYYLHVIYNQTTEVVAGLLSLSAIAPTLPAGYTHFAAVQPLFIKASTTAFIGFSSTSGITEYATRQQVLSAGAETALTAVSLATAVPPGAYPVVISAVTINTSVNSRLNVFEDSSGEHLLATAICNGAWTSQPVGESKRMTQTAYYQVANASYPGILWVTGFRWIP